MTRHTYIAVNSQRTRLQVEALLSDLASEARETVLIVPTFRDVAHYKKDWASESFLFGLTITTFAAWINDRWALYGTGSQMVSPIHRELLLYEVLEGLISRGKVTSLALSPGTITLISSIVEEAFTLLLDREIIHRFASVLTVAEEELCSVLREYAAVLHKRDLCEQMQAMEELSATKLPLPVFVIEGFDTFTVAERRFLDSISRHTEVDVVIDEASLSVKVDGRARELVDLQQCIYDPDPNDPVQPTGAVKFLLPAGQYAKPFLVGKTIIEDVEKHLLEAEKQAEEKGKDKKKIAIKEDPIRYVVSSRDPLKLFQQINPLLCEYNIETTVLARKSFASTDFGKAFLALLNFMFAPRYSTFQMSDFVMSPFSGVSRQKAYELDSAWRGDRRTDKQRCLSTFVKATPAKRGQAIVSALEKSDFSAALAVFEEDAKKNFSWTETYLSEQLAAIKVAQQFFLAVSEIGVKFFGVLQLLEKSTLDCSMRLAPEKPAESEAASDDKKKKTAESAAEQKLFRVDIMSLAHAADEDACSCNTLIVCDLENTSYPVRDVSDAKILLFEKLGIKLLDSALEKARRQFFRLLSTPINQLMIERVLFTPDAMPAYPAVMLEELIDCYRSDLEAFSDIDKRTGLPVSLDNHVLEWGEYSLYENLAVSELGQTDGVVEEPPLRGVIGEEARKLIVLPRSTKAPHITSPSASAPPCHPEATPCHPEATPCHPEATPCHPEATPCHPEQNEGSSEAKNSDAQNVILSEAKDPPLALSPSAIESYLECPHKWFTLRRLRLDEPDAGFGSLEMGIFAHSLFKAFYQSFQQKGFSKVNKDNLDEAKTLLSTLFDQHLANQTKMKQKDKPLIALTALEEATVSSLKKRLVTFLDREADLLPGFTPTYFEQSFGDEKPFAYAGCEVYGTIDRIDVNSKGQAVIIDYKNSLTKDYLLASASELPWASADEEIRISLPEKIQTLIYAQAARKMLNLDVVGALYVSYGRDKKIMGAIDSKILGPADISDINSDACSAQEYGSENFGDLLDSVEENIASALEHLAAGYINPHPRGFDPCNFCPVRACESRNRS